jgi:hypothetical protein
MDIEKLGAFYLGREYDQEAGAPTDATLLYDAKDLTTHAVCVGMTGSGKTGLCVTLLEEAAIDGIPTIAIDPKGDLGNLLLTFPKLRPADFEPWIDPDEAARKGRTPAEHAAWTADLWRNGLADWGQDGKRIARFRDAAVPTIFTPGSRAGTPIAVLRSFAAPDTELDEEAFADRVRSSASGLLGLLGIEADPLRSREHILLSTIFDRAWRKEKDLDLPGLIRAIQDPGFQRVGVFELESFFPSGDRFELAMMLNNLLASPGFAVWNEGVPLEISKLLYAEDGRPRLSILSIAHLSDSERMFFVTLLLNEVLAWIRTQSGSRSLRAILYMDEVFGYFPPIANPPSKKPMLTLLKQARAYGLGVVLATQNPVDLDYKGLSNTGTWFLGRLQTERDKARVMDGLEGAAAAAGGAFDRGALETTLSGLDSRVFVMNNVHDDAPVVFHSRWALSYLGGPLTREQIRTLKKEETVPAAKPAAKARRKKKARPAGAVAPPATRPALPPKIEECFLRPTTVPAAASRCVYRPALLARVAVHYSRSSVDLDHWQTFAVLAPLNDASASQPWNESVELRAQAVTTTADPEDGYDFTSLPAQAAREKSYGKWAKMLATHIYRNRPLTVWQTKKPKAASRAEESHEAFLARLQNLLHEQRDLEKAKLESKYKPKLARLMERIRKAEQRLEREQEQYSDQKTQTAISIGSTILGALFGRKLTSASGVGRATTAMRGAGRAARERGDIKRAGEEIESLRDQLAALNEEFETALEQVIERDGVEAIAQKQLDVAPKKSDIAIEGLSLVWTPWSIDEDGIATACFSSDTNERNA